MNHTRDSQRSRVQQSSSMWADASSAPIALSDAQDLINKVRRSAWFRRNFVIARPGLRVFRWTRNKRAVAYVLAWYCREQYDGRSNASRWAVQTGAAHGREFCHVFLRFVEHIEGKGAADIVRAAFKRHKVKYTKPRARRVLPPLERAALAARLDGMRASRDAAKRAATATASGETCIRCGKPYVAGDPLASHTPDCTWYGVD